MSIRVIYVDHTNIHDLSSIHIKNRQNKGGCMKCLHAVSAISLVLSASLSASSLPTLTGKEKVRMTEHGVLSFAHGPLESMHISFQPFHGETQPGWQMVLPITLSDVRLSPDGTQLVGVDELNQIRLFETQETRRPNGMGKELIAYQQDDMRVHVFTHPSPGKLLLAKADVHSSNDALTRYSTSLSEFDVATKHVTKSLTIPGQISGVSCGAGGIIFVKKVGGEAGLIKEMSKVDMDRGELTPLRTSLRQDAPFSTTVAKDLTTNKEHAYFISYAGATRDAARVLNFHAKTNRYGVAYVAAPLPGGESSSASDDAVSGAQDILCLRMAAHAPRACVLLGGKDGSVHRVAVLDVEDGILRENEALTLMVKDALLHKRVEKIKIAPRGSHLLIDTLDMQTPGWVRARELISLPDAGLTTLASWRLDMPDVVAQTLSSTASDGVLSYTHLYTPRSATGKIPLLVMLHAGPHDQHAQGYAPETAHFAGRGYGVAWVNYRGSTGRGKVFLDLTGPKRGFSEVDDVASAVSNLLSTHPLLDASNVFIMGHSYGGYIALRLGGARPDLVKGIMAIGGACLWKDDTPDSSQMTPLAEGGYLYINRGPADYIAQITRPTLVFDAIKRDVVQQEGIDCSPNLYMSDHPQVRLMSLKSIGCPSHFQEETALTQVMVHASEFMDELHKGVVPERHLSTHTPAQATLVESEAFNLQAD
ncbi:MAG: hypothetical protein C0514_02915 [Candidatus Puniceispirillum sp.]|nr:hypothetical protein [Candidatus Puniceispirillum sp.]